MTTPMTNPSTEELLREVQELDASATKGPWAWDDNDGDGEPAIIVAFDSLRTVVDAVSGLKIKKCDAKFIARSRLLLPLLAERLREYEEEILAVKEAHIETHAELEKAEAEVQALREHLQVGYSIIIQGLDLMPQEKRSHWIGVFGYQKKTLDILKEALSRTESRIPIVESEAVPENEVHLVNSDEQVVGKIVNVIDPFRTAKSAEELPE